MDLATLKEFGVGRRQPDDDLFKAGDKVCRMYAREGIYDVDEEQLCHTIITSFPCYVPTCPQEFSTVLDYEVHYNSCHRFICTQCKKPLPSPHLLDLHLSETHDSFFLAQADRKPMYSCFVEDCQTKSVNAAERRTHCIEVHKFPHDFRFDQSLKKQKTGSSKKKDHKLSSEQQEESTQKDGSKVTLKKPFTFGHGKQGKTFGHQKPWHKTGKLPVDAENKSESLNLDELMETLPAE